MWDESSLGGSRERGGIDMMVYSIAKDPEWGGQRKSNVAKIGRDATLPSAVRKMPRVEGAVGKLAVTSRGGKEKRGKFVKIIQSHIGQRSCMLRDRTQNGAAVPPRPGTRRRRQSKCTYGRVWMVAVAFVVRERAETTMMSRKRNRSSIASTFVTMLGKSKPV